MLAVVRGRAGGRLQVVLYAWAMVACSLLLIPVAHMGLLYTAVALGRRRLVPLRVAPPLQPGDPARVRVADARVPRLDRLPDADLPRRRDRSAAAVLSVQALTHDAARPRCAPGERHPRGLRGVPGPGDPPLDPAAGPVHPRERRVLRPQLLPARRGERPLHRLGPPRGGRPLLGVVEVRRDEAPRSASLGCWLAPRRRGATATCGRRWPPSWRTPSIRRARLHPAPLGVPAGQRGEQSAGGGRGFAFPMRSRTSSSSAASSAQARDRSATPRRRPRG